MEVTLKQLEGILPQVLKAGIVPYMKSSPAIGKSALAHQIAAKYGLKVIDMRLAECEPVELAGFPYFDQETKKATYYPVDTFPLETDPIPDGYTGWLILLDEFSSCPIATQSAAYKLVLDRQIGQFKLHPKALLIAAGNKEDDNAIVNPMSSALVSRFAIFEVALNQKDWNEWAASNGIDYRITSYMNFRPDHLYTFHPDTADKPYASPRTWAMVSRVIKDTSISENTLAILASLIGEGVAREFNSFLELEKDLPTFDSIIKNPEGISIKPDLSIKWAIIGMVSAKLTHDTVVPITKLLDRFPNELKVVAMREICLRHPDIFDTSKDFNAWFIKVTKECLS